MYVCLRALLFLAIFAPAVAAQEPAYYQGMQAVRFAEGPDRFRYIVPCKVPVEHSPEMTSPIPGTPTEDGLCWTVVAGFFHILPDNKLDGTPSVPGTLSISSHHVRFVPDSLTNKAIYFDFSPADVSRSTGLPKNQTILFGDKKDSFFRLFLKTACLKCTASLETSQSITPQVTEEINLLMDATLHFDVVRAKLLAIAKLQRVEFNPANQPTLSDVHEAMQLYSDLNRKLLPLCPASARSCIQSYVDYQAFNAASPAGSCGSPPSCTAVCPLGIAETRALNAHACSSQSDDRLTLHPDWTEFATKMQLAHPIDPNTLLNKPIEQGCTVNSGYTSAITRAALPPNDKRLPSGSGGVVGMMGMMGPARVSGNLQVSEQLMLGNVISKTAPIYPPVAKAAHVSGTVLLHAIITTGGTISDLSVISGPEMLRDAAIDAVSKWVYKPYVVDGKAVKVDTTISVNFHFGG